MSDAFGVLGQAGIAVTFVVLGILSRRLGQATRAQPLYIGFFVAALLTLVGAGGRAANALFRLVSPQELAHSPLWVLIYDGLPALAMTLAVVLAWHYWSWLLAERD